MGPRADNHLCVADIPPLPFLPTGRVVAGEFIRLHHDAYEIIFGVGDNRDGLPAEHAISAKISVGGNRIGASFVSVLELQWERLNTSKLTFI